MARITWADKIALIITGLAHINVWKDADANELKDTSDNHDERLDNLEQGLINEVVNVSAIWTGSGLNYNVTAENFGGAESGKAGYFSATADLVTLTVADGSDERIDRIGVFYPVAPATLGIVGKIDGIPGSGIAEDYDPELFFHIRFATVEALATTPKDTSNETIYTENAGEPNEWVASDNTANIVQNSTNDPDIGTVSIEGTNVIKGNINIFTDATTSSTSDFDLLTYRTKLKASMGNSSWYIKFFNSTTQIGLNYKFRNGQNNFDSSNISTYQSIRIDLAKLNLPVADFDIIQIYPYIGFTGYFIDEVYLHKGSSGGVVVQGVEEAPINALYGRGNEQWEAIEVTPNGFTGTDTEKIQQAVDFGSANDIPIRIPEKDDSNTPWDIEEAILLASNTTIVIDGAILKLTDTSRDNFFRTENCGFGITSPFDDLENIHILGLNGATLMGADDPRATGDAAKDLVDDGTNLFNKSYGNDTGEGGETQTGDWRNIGILFAYTDKYSVKGINFEQMHMWAVSNEKCTRGRFNNLTFDNFAERTIPSKGTQYVRNNDGVNFRMGCSNMIVDDLTGYTDDDAGASTIADTGESAGIFGTTEVTGNVYAGSEHDNYDITFKNINIATQAHLVRLLNDSGTEMYDITIRNITDRLTAADIDGVGACVVIGSSTSVLGDLYKVSIDNVKNIHKPYAVLVSGALADSNINNIIDISTVNNDYPVYFDGAGDGARDVQLSNIFKTDEANDFAALYDGDPAVLIPMKEIAPIVALSDTATALSAGATVESIRIPYAFRLIEVRGSVITAGTTSSIIADINLTGTGTIMTTDKIEIEATEKTSLDATTQPALTTTDLAEDDELTFDIDSVDSGGTGAGLRVTLIGYRI